MNKSVSDESEWISRKNFLRKLNRVECVNTRFFALIGWLTYASICGWPCIHQQIECTCVCIKIPVVDLFCLDITFISVLHSLSRTIEINEKILIFLANLLSLVSVAHFEPTSLKIYNNVKENFLVHISEQHIND
jgi:hypothetical protein